jgi:cytochrome c5
MTKKYLLETILPTSIGLLAATVVFLPALQAPRVIAAEPVEAEKTTAATTTTATTAAATEPAQKQIKGGSQLWSENCARCHNMRSPSSYSDAEWETVMFHMRVRARLTPAEDKAITEFLKSAN